MRNVPNYMYQSYAKLALCAVAFYSVTVPSIGATVEEDVLERLDTLVVKVRPAGRAMRSATALQTLSREQFENTGVQSVADAVRRFAGANVKDYGGIGGMKTVSVRNLGAAHTAVSYDGIAVSNCQAGQIDIGRFTLQNLGEIGLVVGQAHDLVQPARLFASASVLQLQTAKPIFRAGSRYTALARLKAGSFGEVNPTLSYAQQLGTRTTLQLNGDYMRADGTYPFTIKSGSYETNEKRRNSAVKATRVEANLYHAFSPASTLDTKLYYYNSARQLPGAVILYNNSANERLWDENFFAQMHYRTTFSPQWTLQVQGKYNHAWSKYEDVGSKYPGGKQTDVHRQDEYYLSAAAGWRPHRNWHFSLAQDATINKLRNNLDDCPFPTRLTSLTALNARYTQRKVTVTGTLVNTFAKEEVEQGTRPDNRKRLDPSLSVVYTPFDELPLRLRAMYKNIYRMPTFNDLYYRRMGNRSLRPEKATSYNLGATYSVGEKGCMEYLELSADGYINRVEDKIVAFPTTYVWRMANFGKVHVEGIDVTLATSLRAASWLSIGLSGAYTYQQAQDYTDASSKTYQHQIPYTPKHSGNVSATFETPWINLGYSILAVGERYSASQNLPEYLVERYNDHTLTLWRNWQLKSLRMRLQGEVTNLTNQQYAVIQYYPMAGRAYRATLQFEL